MSNYHKRGSAVHDGTQLRCVSPLFCQAATSFAAKHPAGFFATDLHAHIASGKFRGHFKMSPQTVQVNLRLMERLRMLAVRTVTVNARVHRACYSLPETNDTKGTI